jgi:hypothetical protein
LQEIGAGQRSDNKRLKRPANCGIAKIIWSIFLKNIFPIKINKLH